MTLFRRKFLALALVLSTALPAAAAEPLLRPGDRVAIVGDSITEQKLYSKYMECYLLACSGVPDIEVMQFGWSGEQASGFASRAENDLAGFRPTVVTLCYGMNDGGYQPWRAEIGAAYEANMRNVLKKLEGLGVRTVVIGSPGAVDQHFFRPGQMMGSSPAHVAYNDNLAHLRDIDKKLAAEFNQPFANVHDAMYETMQKAQAALGAGYDVCGRDGFHPGPNGQLIMAYAFLKALQPDGNIGEISVELKDGALANASGSAGHKVSAASDATGLKVQVESTRWPYVFEGDAKSSAGTRSIAPFVPFNGELNRLTLKVAGLTTPKGVITWGDQTKEFPAEKLAAGINLAAEFDKTPFDGKFAELQAAVAQKQNFETVLVKQIVTNFRGVPAPLLQADAELAGALATVKTRLFAHQAELSRQARATLGPVKHTLTVGELP
jgi:lysophospholipase L1-like esterase